jgi:ATP-binding cassette subfamily B (MDR/TAP) protein 1
LQAALANVSKGKTTISIAHRLSTVRNVDHICVFDKGKVVESDSHDQLLALKGKYWELVHAQNLN